MIYENIIFRYVSSRDCKNSKWALSNSNSFYLPCFRAVVLKLGSARQIFWDREAPSKKIKTTILKKKFCVKLSFQASFPINLTNTICHETLQAT